MQVLLDPEDLERWRGYRWELSEHGYVIGAPKRKGGVGRKFLHRLIAKPTRWQVVHHKNKNKLDNRKENLECLTRLEHARRHSQMERARISRRRELVERFGKVGRNAGIM